MGGRSVAIVLSEMAGAITSFDINTNEQQDASESLKSRILKKFSKSSPKRLKVSFNPDTHKFIIEQIQDSNK